MCLEMANVIRNHEAVPDNLRQQLAVAVRSIQWSYAIFWSLSPSQHGVLEWLDGYYNGDIKTRKTVQAMELKADKIGLQRSEQLRELFESLSEGESEQQAKRPSAALSPEDLSDAEWYYLVCMSFVFNPGQGLPGRALATGQTIWLSNASYADSEVFSRSLLAKSASIQTVVCFPHLGGVIELGVTELVPEDASLLQRVKASLLELSKPVCAEKSLSVPTDDDRDSMCAKVGHNVVDTLSLENLYSPTEEIKLEEGMNILHDNIHEEFTMDSLDECSTGCEHNHQTEDSFMLEGVNGAASQVQSWHFMDDDLSNGAQDSMNSSDCISEAFVNQEKALCSSNCEHENRGLKQLQDSNHTKLSSLDLGPGDDLFYRRTISVILRGSRKLVESPYPHGCDCKTNFKSWKKGESLDGHKARGSQNMLKKILCTIPLMHGSLKPEKENGGNKGWLGKLETDDVSTGHVFPQKIRENEKFLVLRSMVPSISEIDKSSILSDTIKYLKELEARVEELKSCMDSAELEAEARRKYADMVEQKSDNHEKRKVDSGKKVWLNKRKACDVIDENDPELNRVVTKEGLSQYVKVSMKGQEVLIEMRCAFREYILLDIMDAINNLHLDAHTVQSSTLDGVLTMTLKSKFRGTAIAPVGMIKQTLCKVTGKC